MRLALKVIQDLEHYISSWDKDKAREVSRGRGQKVRKFGQTVINRINLSQLHIVGIQDLFISNLNSRWSVARAFPSVPSKTRSSRP